MIKQKFFKHGWYYLYRIHSKKLNQIPEEYENLKNYLNDMLDNCPNKYFETGPRSSQTKIQLDNIKIHKIEGHEVCALAKQALNIEIKQTPHNKIQNYFLQNDKRTIAVETPIWMKKEELKNFEEIFNSKEPLTGHIDLIRSEDNYIWVWDYKPNAKKEKYASTQVCLYATMLSKRTNIPIEKFKCGYFNEKIAFVFKPQNIEVIQKILKD